MRKRMTKIEIEILEDQIIKVLAHDNPQTVRHVFYRMTDPRLAVPVEKTEAGYNQIGARLRKMRENGIIPYGWIVDSTRGGIHTNTFSSIGEFLETMACLYRRNPWENCSQHVEVWCESRSLQPILEEVCEKYAVSLYATAGFCSLTLAYDAVQRIHQIARERYLEDVHIIWIGDYDQAGVLIDKNVETQFEKHLLKDLSLRFDRIAINGSQIIEYDLPTKPRKKGDKRAPEIKRTVESEAMPAALMQDLLMLQLQSYVSSDLLEQLREIEIAEREVLYSLAQEYK